MEQPPHTTHLQRQPSIYCDGSNDHQNSHAITTTCPSPTLGPRHIETAVGAATAAVGLNEGLRPSRLVISSLGQVCFSLLLLCFYN